MSFGRLFHPHKRRRLCEAANGSILVRYQMIAEKRKARIRHFRESVFWRLLLKMPCGCSGFCQRHFPPRLTLKAVVLAWHEHCGPLVRPSLLQPSLMSPICGQVPPS